MPGPIDFYFDFSSPYGYLAALSIDPLGAEQGREVRWRPFLLGALFKATGSQPLLDIPLKGPYARHDLERTARRLAVPFVIPDPFPFASVAACRAFYYLDDRAPDLAKDLAKALFHEAFGMGRDIGPANRVIEVAAGLGIDEDELAAALGDPSLKARLRQEVAAAEAAEVFGSPFFIADGEAFWGQDRMADLAEWLKRGGW